MLRLLPKSKVGGIPRSDAYHKSTPDVNACANIHFQMKIPDLSASTNPKKLAFLQIRPSNFALQTTFFKFYLQTALFKVGLHALSKNVKKWPFIHIT
eukprot:UN06840